MKKKQTRIKGIFFDVGGTLIFPDPRKISNTLEETTGRKATSHACLKAIHHSTAEMDRSLADGSTPGQDWWEIYFDGMLAALPLASPLAKPERNRFLRTLHLDHLKNNLWSHPAKGASKVLREFRKQKYYLGVISNSDGRVRSQLEEKNLARFFSFILDSHVVRCEKPHREIFLMGIETSGLEPAEILYVGDFVNIDYTGATRVGMKAVIIDPLSLRNGWGAPTLPGLPDLPAWIVSTENGP